MKYTLTIEDVKKIKDCIKETRGWSDGLDKDGKKNLIRKSRNFIIENDMLYLQMQDKCKEIIPDDDQTRLIDIFNILHHPDCTGMKSAKSMSNSPIR